MRDRLNESKKEQDSNYWVCACAVVVVVVVTPNIKRVALYDAWWGWWCMMMMMHDDDDAWWSRNYYSKRGQPTVGTTHQDQKDSNEVGRTDRDSLGLLRCCQQQGIVVEFNCHAHRPVHIYSSTFKNNNIERTYYYYYYYTTNIKEREKTPHQSEDDLGYLYRNLLPTLFVCGMASIARDRRKRQRIIRIRTQLVFVRRWHACLCRTKKNELRGLS